MTPCLQAYELRQAGAVLHSHSMNAVLATLLDPTAKEFRVTNLEMVKVGSDLARLVGKVHAAWCLPHASSDLCPNLEGSLQCALIHKAAEVLSLQGIAGVGYFDSCVVPIIENTARECELTDRLRQAIKEYPDAHAVLVRRHGVYVWGSTWIQVSRSGLASGLFANWLFS